MNKKQKLEKSLKIKDQIEAGVDIDKYLEAILKEYEGFIEQKQNEFDYFCKKTQDTLLSKLMVADLYLRRGEDEQLRIFKKIKKKIAEKQKQDNEEKEEKRKLLILAIKKIRG
ncbi:hypothetical protein ES705_21343 [subsurface metagenome]